MRPIDGATATEAHGTGEMRHGDQVLAAITGPFAFDAPLAFSWCP
jgi:hypothetical protein